MPDSELPHRGIVISEARWPIVEMKIFGHVTLSEIDAAYDALERIARRGERHAHLTDLRQINPLGIPATLRQRFAARERELVKIAAGKVVADARVVDHPVVRGLLTAFEWMVGEVPWPVRNVKSEEDALAWLAEHGF